MKVSLNEIKKLVPEAEKVETTELVRLIGSRLVEVFRGLLCVNCRWLTNPVKCRRTLKCFGPSLVIPMSFSNG